MKILNLLLGISHNIPKVLCSEFQRRSIKIEDIFLREGQSNREKDTCNLLGLAFQASQILHKFSLWDFVIQINQCLFTQLSVEVRSLKISWRSFLWVMFLELKPVQVSRFSDHSAPPLTHTPLTHPHIMFRLSFREPEDNISEDISGYRIQQWSNITSSHILFVHSATYMYLHFPMKLLPATWDVGPTTPLATPQHTTHTPTSPEWPDELLFTHKWHRTSY